MIVGPRIDQPAAAELGAHPEIGVQAEPFGEPPRVEREILQHGERADPRARRLEVADTAYRTRTGRRTPRCGTARCPATAEAAIESMRSGRSSTSCMVVTPEMRISLRREQRGEEHARESEQTFHRGLPAFAPGCSVDRVTGGAVALVMMVALLLVAARGRATATRRARRRARPCGNRRTRRARRARDRRARWDGRSRSPAPARGGRRDSRCRPPASTVRSRSVAWHLAHATAPWRACANETGRVWSSFLTETAKTHRHGAQRRRPGGVARGARRALRRTVVAAAAAVRRRDLARRRAWWASSGSRCRRATGAARDRTACPVAARATAPRVRAAGAGATAAVRSLVSMGSMQTHAGPDAPEKSAPAPHARTVSLSVYLLTPT